MCPRKSAKIRQWLGVVCTQASLTDPTDMVPGSCNKALAWLPPPAQAAQTFPTLTSPLVTADCKFLVFIIKYIVYLVDNAIIYCPFLCVKISPSA